jgi:hypothetical protein
LNCTFVKKQNRGHGSGIPGAACSRNGSTI